MSNASSKRSAKCRYVIIALLLVITIVGGFGYQVYTRSPANANSSSALEMSTAVSSELSVSQSTESANVSVGADNGTQPTVPVTLSGAGIGVGGTLPASLFKVWSTQIAFAFPAITLKYSTSATKITKLVKGSLDFVTSDIPLTNAQFAATPGLIEMPETLGGVGITYNLSLLGLPNSTLLNFTPEVLVGIYFGQITQWNDPRIATLNPTLKLPGNLITAVHRSDASGTTYAFTSYLSAVSPTWATEVGYGSTIKWPADTFAAGIGAKGNAGVAAVIQKTAGALGYVDINYALDNHLTFGAIRNAAGNYVAPSVQTIEWAAANATVTNGTTGVQLNLLNPPGQLSYPITYVTYLVLYKDMSKNSGITVYKAEALANFLRWSIHDGQQYAPDLLYAPLPENIVSADQQILTTLNYNGTPLPTSS
ncbi:MAG TPA: phosphate ABC transporter substrate-binding protein PstS [Candidatus Saccharimonadales bacterium]|nr:phosphate ABC transporter substrate-binding protein PstS [Candidatus Saccharimonadales bacterium]